jgi:drug/metabolite transporter (DMT)-like permease
MLLDWARSASRGSDSNGVLCVALSLLAALLFAGSASMQQHVVRGTVAPPAGARTRQGLLTAPTRAVQAARQLVRSRLWLAGCAANICGSLVQAAALHIGTVATVQLVLVTQLIFALPLGTLWYQRWPRSWDWLAGLAICAGLALFLSVPGAAPEEGNPDRWRVGLATVCAALLICLFAVAASGRRGLLHAALIASAAGVCFALSAVLLKVTLASLLGPGIAATATSWFGYGLAVFNIAGFVIEQKAFAAGSLAAAVATMTIANPVASYFLGVLAFRAEFPTAAEPLAALAGAGALITVGVTGLAHSPMVRCEPGRSRARPPSPAKSG